MSELESQIDRLVQTAVESIDQAGMLVIAELDRLEILLLENEDVAHIKQAHSVALDRFDGLSRSYASLVPDETQIGVRNRWRAQWRADKAASKILAVADEEGVEAGRQAVVDEIGRLLQTPGRIQCSNTLEGWR